MISRMSTAVFSRRARCDGHCKAKFNHILARVPCPSMPARACSRKCAPASLLAQVLSGNVLETCSARRVLCASCPAHLNSVQVALHKRAYFCMSSSITGNASVCAFRITSRQLLQTHPRAHDSSQKSLVVAHRPPCIDQAHPASVLLRAAFVMFCREGSHRAALKITFISRAELPLLAQVRSRKLSCARVLAQVCSRKLSRTCSRASVLAQVVSRASCLARARRRARESVSCRCTRARRLAQVCPRSGKLLPAGS